MGTRAESLPVGVGFGKGSKYPALATAQLAEAFAEVVSVGECVVVEAVPHLVEQIPIPAGRPQLADQVTDLVHTHDVQQ
jgi:hypothetical protein